MNRPPERRKHVRSGDVFIVTYRLKEPLGVTVRTSDRQYAGVAVDIGEGGIGVDVARALDVGLRIRVEFEIVNEFAVFDKDRIRRFDLEGECVYCQPVSNSSFRIGVVFKDPAADDNAFIAKYVKDQALRKYIV